MYKSYILSKYLRGFLEIGRPDAGPEQAKSREKTGIEYIVCEKFFALGQIEALDATSLEIDAWEWTLRIISWIGDYSVYFVALYAHPWDGTKEFFILESLVQLSVSVKIFHVRKMKLQVAITAQIW